MTRSTQKIAKLQKKFPGIQAALQRLYDMTEQTDQDVLSIHVETLDANIMAQVPELYCGNEVALCHETGNLLGRQHQLFFAINDQHQPVGSIGAIQCNEKLRDNTALKHLVFEKQIGLKYVIRLTVTEWCKKLSYDQSIGHRDTTDTQLGERKERCLDVVVYKVPDEGLAKLLPNIACDNVRMYLRGMKWGVNNPVVSQLLTRGRLCQLRREFEQLFFAQFKTALHQGSPRYRVEGRIGEIEIYYHIGKNGSQKELLEIDFRKGEISFGFEFINRGQHPRRAMSQEQLADVDAEIRPITEAFNNAVEIVYSDDYEERGLVFEFVFLFGTVQEVCDVLKEVNEGIRLSRFVPTDSQASA